MKKITQSLCLAILLCATFAVACGKKEPPGPAPEPTPAVEPTKAPPGENVAVCYSPSRIGSPPYCENAAGKLVTCPVDTSSLPNCVR